MLRSLQFPAKRVLFSLLLPYYRFHDSCVLQYRMFTGRTYIVLEWNHKSSDGGEPIYAFERAEFDKQYPQHPLTQIRRLVAHIITSN